jgi:hypothetical protein
LWKFNWGDLGAFFVKIGHRVWEAGEAEEQRSRGRILDTYALCPISINKFNFV